MEQFFPIPSSSPSVIFPLPLSTSLAAASSATADNSVIIDEITSVISSSSSTSTFRSAPSTPATSVASSPMDGDDPPPVEPSNNNNTEVDEEVIVDDATLWYIAEQTAIVLRTRFNPWRFHNDSLLESAAWAGASSLTRDPILFAQYEQRILQWLQNYNRRQCPNCHLVLSRPFALTRHLQQNRCPNRRDNTGNQFAFYFLQPGQQQHRPGTIRRRRRGPRDHGGNSHGDGGGGGNQ